MLYFWRQLESWLQEGYKTQKITTFCMNGNGKEIENI